MTMRLFVYLAIVITMALPATAQISGDLGSSKQPIEITADELEIVQPNRVAVFRGNVVAVQGDVTLQARTMTVYYRTAQERGNDLGAVSKIEVNDEVILKTPQESAKGMKGIYDVDKKQILLLGSVVLSRGQNVLRGDRLDYNLQTQKSLLSSVPSAAGGKSGGRVKGVFVPNQ